MHRYQSIVTEEHHSFAKLKWLFLQVTFLSGINIIIKICDHGRLNVTSVQSKNSMQKIMIYTICSKNLTNKGFHEIFSANNNISSSVYDGNYCIQTLKTNFTSSDWLKSLVEVENNLALCNTYFKN